MSKKMVAPLLIFSFSALVGCGNNSSDDKPVNGKVSAEYWNSFFSKVREYNYHSSESYTEWHQYQELDETTGEYKYTYYTYGTSTELDSDITSLVNKITYTYENAQGEKETATNYRVLSKIDPDYNITYLEGMNHVGYIREYTSKSMYCYYTTDIADSFNYYNKYTYNPKTKSYEGTFTYRVIDPDDNRLYYYPDSTLSVTFDDNADKVTLHVIYPEIFTEEYKSQETKYVSKTNEQTVVFSNVGKVSGITAPKDYLVKIYDYISDLGILSDVEGNSSADKVFLEAPKGDKEGETFSIKEPYYTVWDEEKWEYVDITEEALKVQPHTFIDIPDYSDLKLSDYVSLSEDGTTITATKAMTDIDPDQVKYGFNDVCYYNLKAKYNDTNTAWSEIYDYFDVFVCDEAEGDERLIKPHEFGEEFYIDNNVLQIWLTFNPVIPHGDADYILTDIDLTIDGTVHENCIIKSKNIDQKVFELSDIYDRTSYYSDDPKPLSLGELSYVKFKVNYSITNDDGTTSYFYQDIEAKRSSLTEKQ